MSDNLHELSELKQRVKELEEQKPAIQVIQRVEDSRKLSLKTAKIMSMLLKPRLNFLTIAAFAAALTLTAACERLGPDDGNVPDVEGLYRGTWELDASAYTWPHTEEGTVEVLLRQDRSLVNGWMLVKAMYVRLKEPPDSSEIRYDFLFNGKVSGEGGLTLNATPTCYGNGPTLFTGLFTPSGAGITLSSDVLCGYDIKTTVAVARTGE